MSDLETQVLALVAKRSYQPLKPKALARKLLVPVNRYSEFRRVLKDLLKQGRIELGKNHLIRPTTLHGTATGVFRRAGGGYGFVRPEVVDGHAGPEIFVPEGQTLDAATGDNVVVQITRKSRGPDRGPTGRIVQVLERATRQFVGTYFERDGQGYVRVDGTVFSHSIFVGDPGAKGAKPDDKVVVEMLRFPSLDDRGEAVITEILGVHGQPGIDTLSVIRAFGLPDKFPEDVLEEARQAAAHFDESKLHGREDFTDQITVTIDPVDARDFDDAVSLTIDPKTKHWQLAVHIADVAHFAPHGGALDREARKRGTSVYLPQRVIPMFPEIISNSLASLQQGRVRYVKSALIEFTPAGAKTNVRFANGAIKNQRRFTYQEVSDLLKVDGGKTVYGGQWTVDGDRESGPEAATVHRPPTTVHQPPITSMLFHMRDLAMILRKRRFKRGALELDLPEVELEYDADGRVTGAHYVHHDVSHQIVEEFMLAANEAVAEHLSSLGVPFLRRVHPAPEPNKLKAFAEFARILGYKMQRETDRFALQRVLAQSADKPDSYAVHFALLRSLKQAAYSPQEEGHYALASDDYCHFTSPIRRYPDLTVHRLLDRWLRTGRCGSDATELAALAGHCSRTERRAETAERELVKFRLLTYMSERLGLELEVIVTGVADYGFYGQSETLPVDGLVHVSTMTDDYYYFDARSHSLIGQRTKRRYRLGDKVKVKVVRVDLQRRQLDFRRVLDEKPSRRKKR
jgi:ribonuclease R